MPERESQFCANTYLVNEKRTEIEIQPAGTSNKIVINDEGITMTGYTPPALSRVLYFTGAVDNDWSNLNNWFLDDQCPIPALSLPTEIDDVVIQATLDANSGDPAVCRNLGYTDGYLAIPIICSGDARFINNSTIEGYNYGPGTLNCVNAIMNNSSAYGATSGVINASDTVTFNNAGMYVYASTTAPNVIFNNDAVCGGTVNGDATFNDSSYTSSATINGNATFNDASNNSAATITGDIVCNTSGTCTPQP